MKIGEVIKKIKKDGWYLVRVKGSHRQYKYKNKKLWLQFLVTYYI